MTVISLGVHAQGAVPLDTRYQFLSNETGLPIDLTGATASIATVAPDGTRASYPAVLADPADGVVGIVWQPAMTATPGPWSMLVWVEDGSNVLDSARLAWGVYPAAAPS